MPVVTQQAPQFTVEAAEGLARSRYGLTAAARPLPSYIDQNFLLLAADGARFVLKIANAAEDRAVLDFQQGALDYLAAQHPGIPCQHVRPPLSGEPITTVEDDEGTAHLVWMVTYLPGRLMAHVRPHTPELLRSLGRFLGRLDAALEGFLHPAMHRYMPWDLKRALDHRPRLAHVEEPAQRALVERFLAHFETAVLPVLPRLRASVIHNDANDYNVLVEGTGWDAAVAGLIDFGDMVHTPTVCELAAGVTYAMLGKADPLASAAQVVGGYHEAYPLAEEELDALYGLIGARLCISVLMAAHRKKLEPENAYLTISEAPAWALLEHLAGVHPRLARATFRHACGLDPCPEATRVAAWLKEHAAAVAPVVGHDLKEAPVVVFDFSVGSTEWDYAALTQPTLAARAVAERMRAEGAAVGVGRYDEARLVYTAEQFGENEAERRTVHLGLDLFQEAGSPVFAPLEGTVHSFADNARPLDYGPTILLEHRVSEDLTFYTLYGHLSRASLDGLQAGKPVRKGEHIGWLGETHENGGWAPHLHLQLIADLLGCKGDFPGVAKASERAVWLGLCPDPNLLMGIPAARFPARERSREEILAARAAHLG